ncbi:MAG: trehalose-6-phosphate synthase, partial [Brevibacterium sp.]|nr:trehalose-6-phosphate synthase [Brevibacterium sp.]MDN5608636.1 trehalose-6-phosphate synthase [Brevibacterium sp.]
AGILDAVQMDEKTRSRRMRQMRKKIATDTVSIWSKKFLAELEAIHTNPEAIIPDRPAALPERSTTASDRVTSTVTHAPGEDRQ